MKGMFKIKKLLKENRGFIIFILLMSVFRSAVADYNSVPTGSMLPTIVPGDQITIDKLAYDIKVPFINHSLMRLNEPKRGEIVVFESKSAGMRMVKRVIGLPGDRVAMVKNQVLINGEALTYQLTDSEVNRFIEQLPSHPHDIQLTDKNGTPYDSFNEVVVPQDQYLVLGDNRQNSADSRAHGFIPRDEIIGRAQRVLVSFDYDANYLPRTERVYKPLI